MNFDSSLLQFVPKGSYYNTDDSQIKAMEKIWEDFFNYDRTIFTLSSILPGTEYSKGRMSHILLSNPRNTDKALVPQGLPANFEEEIIKWNLRNGSMAKSIKNLLMLAGIKKDDGTFAIKKVNNARTRRIILDFIFDRDIDSLQELVIKFKPKVSKLIRHSLGIQDLTKLINKDKNTVVRLGNKYPLISPVVQFLFGSLLNTEDFPKFQLYKELKNAAKKGYANIFIELAKQKQIPFETLLGFRNTYKLDVEISELYNIGKMSETQKFQAQSAAKKSGIELKVDFNKQDIYNLWKLFYVKTIGKEKDKIDEIAEAIMKKSAQKLGVDLGETVVIFDVSKSMEGSIKRPFHPFLTGLSLISKLDNVKDVIYAGGNMVKTPSEKIPNVVMPSGSTAIWKALLEAAEKKPNTVLIISDGYENSIKGAFAQVYEKIKNDGAKFNILHVNPVFASEVSGLRKLANDVEPMPLDDYKYLTTNIIFKLVANKDFATQMLVKEVKKRIEFQED